MEPEASIQITAKSSAEKFIDLMESMVKEDKTEKKENMEADDQCQ